MPFDHITAFGTSRGNLSDDERLRAQQAQFQQSQNSQLAALQAEIADRQAGRTFQGGENDKLRAFQGGMFDKDAVLQKDLDASATQRALGVVNAQMAPALLGAQDDHSRYTEGLPVRQAEQAAILKAINGMSGAGGVPGAAPVSIDQDPDFQKNLTMLSVLKGGSAPDFAKRDYEKQALAMDMEDRKRTRGLDRAMAFRNAGDEEQARAAAIEAGSPLPAVTADAAMAGSPSVANALGSVDAAGKKLSGSNFLFEDPLQNPERTDPIKNSVAEAIKLLVGRGVKPEEARAFVLKRLKDLAGPEGSHGLNLGWGYNKGADALAKLAASGL